MRGEPDSLLCHYCLYMAVRVLACSFRRMVRQAWSFVRATGQKPILRFSKAEQGLEDLWSSLSSIQGESIEAVIQSHPGSAREPKASNRITRQLRAWALSPDSSKLSGCEGPTTPITRNLSPDRINSELETLCSALRRDFSPVLEVKHHHLRNASSGSDPSSASRSN